MTIRIERCNDLGMGDEIKQLFLRNERPNFPGNFDLVYPESYATGGSSWLVRDASNSLVGHIAVFPRTFRYGDRVMPAAVFGDLMMDAEHRDFFSGARLARQATGDLKRASGFEFAFAHSIEMAAGVLRAGGLNLIGNLRRYVRPVNAVYGAMMGIKTRARRLVVERFTDPWEDRIMSALRSIPAGSYMRGQRTVSSYKPNLGRESLTQWEWITLRPKGEKGSEPAAVALVATHADVAMAVQDLAWDESRVSADSVLHTLAATARESGLDRVSMNALTPSRWVETLKRCGFMLRVDTLALLTLKVGSNEIPPFEDWLLTFVDGTAW